MYLLIFCIIVLVNSLNTVSAKCEILNEFKEEVDRITSWAAAKCEASEFDLANFY